jgi:hypothetical protein
MVGLLELEIGMGELLAEHAQVAALLPLCRRSLSRLTPALCRGATVAIEKTGRPGLAGPYHQNARAVVGRTGPAAYRRGRRRTWRCRARPGVVVLDAGRR